MKDIKQRPVTVSIEEIAQAYGYDYPRQRAAMFTWLRSHFGINPIQWKNHYPIEWLDGAENWQANDRANRRGRYDRKEKK